MKIAVVAPVWTPIPPESYGGIELVVDHLAVGFQEAGHEVLLFCTEDSTCPVPQRATLPTAEGERLGMAVPEMLHVSAAYAELDGFDIVHDHTVVGPFYAERSTDIPVVTTAHGPMDGELGQLYQRLADNVHLVAISKAQAESAPQVRVARIIHHGVDIDSFPFGEGDGNHFLFLGRMTPEKGAHRAVDAAKKAGVPLLLAAKCREPAEKEYFEARVEPELNDDICYIGEVETEEKLELLSSARGLLFPIRWKEPFGMVMIEAMACGTPILAFPEGSVLEIVEDAKTGFLCGDESEMADAIGRVGDINRRACRASVEERFSTQRMVEAHLELFHDLVSR